jgi:hypothetical protein
MKRSEFLAKRESYWTMAKNQGSARDENLQVLLNRDLCAALEAGVVWDAEEPEVAWEQESVRLLVDGRWQFFTLATMGDWIDYQPNRRFIPIYDELARRLLAERELSVVMEEQRTEIRGVVSGDDYPSLGPNPDTWVISRTKQATVQTPPDSGREAAVITKIRDGGEPTYYAIGRQRKTIQEAKEDLRRFLDLGS